jgi:hypothetical protein
MERLEVSGAVRPLKWPLGVKWLITHVVMSGCAGCGRVELGRKQCALCENCYCDI